MMDLKAAKDEIVSLSNERDKLSSDIQRLQIKKEEAENSLKDLEDKCRSLGFDPATLDQEILGLEEQCQHQISDYKTKLQQLSLKLKSYKE